MSLRERTRPGLGIIEPCLPSTAKAPPSGPGWLHEIKHDGFRIMARRDSAGIRLITRNGDFTNRTSCTPSEVTIPQLADVVLNYMNRNPDKRDLAAAALVVAAMDEAWCPQAPAAPSAQNKER